MTNKFSFEKNHHRLLRILQLLLDAGAPLVLSVGTRSVRLSSGAPLEDPEQVRDLIEAMFGIGAQLHG